MIFGMMAEARSLENPSNPITGQSLEEFISSQAGYTVTPEVAMRLTAVYSCIYVLSSSIAQLPMAVLRKTPEGITAATDHPAFYLLHDEPNEAMTSYTWRQTKQAHILGWGNGYSRIQRSRRGEVESIELCLPQVTSLEKQGGRRFYATQDEDDRPLAVAAEDMIHVLALSISGRAGVSPVRQHAETIGLGLAAQRYGKQFFDGGGRPTGLLTVKNADLKQDGWERLKSVWVKAVSALKTEDNKTLLLPADLDYKALTIAPEDAQFIETRKLSRSEIAGLYNVPAHMINDLEKATFSNISEQAIQFVRHTIMPWVVNWEQEINRKVFSLAERRAGYYIKLNLAGLLRGTPAERAAFYHAAITDGWMDRNEVRALEDLNPREGLGEMLISVNAKPSSQLGLEPPPAPKPPPDPTPEA
jgi:HK97 family phage portal protein